MKNALLVFTILSSLSIVQAQEKAFDTIKTLLSKQQDAWNKGDIDEFMETYWKSDELQFVNKGGPTYGWQATLDNYKKRYPSKEAMGQLTFSIVKMDRRSKKVYSMIGTYYLERPQLGDLNGYFLLIWEKIKGEWVIVADSTN